MVKLEEHKQSTQGQGIQNLPLPDKAYIPLSQHMGKPCQALVKAGDTVSLAQKIASVQASVYAPIHASISGKVLAIQDWPHPVTGRGKAIVIDGSIPVAVNPEQGRGIESGGWDKTQDAEGRTQNAIDKLSPQQIRSIVLEAGIVGMGGAGFPTHIKLNPPKPVDTLIINGAECEPYLTGDYRLMVEKTQEIVRGIELIRRCLGVKNVYVAIEDNKPEAIKAFNYELRVTNYGLRILKSQYPQGGERQLIKNILGREVPRAKLPFDIGVVVHNVGTAFAVCEAVYKNKPLYERVVSVSGSCLANPKNLLVRIGTPIRELIDFCGPLREEPAKIIIGGPMMGIAQFSTDVPVIKSTTGLILFSKNEAEGIAEEFCIRCGACVRECPVSLMPCLINLASEKELWPQAKNYGAADCIECGLCNYVCPSNRRLVESIKRAKLELAR